MKYVWGCVAIYVLIGMMAFGYCYGDIYHDFDGYKYEADRNMGRVLTSTICGAIWPLYISAQVGKHFHETIEAQ